MIGQRLRVLIIAHEFSPYRGSECAVGWNIVTRLAAHHDVTVLYASGSQPRPNSYVEAVNEYFLEVSRIPGFSLINIDQPAFTRCTAYVNSLFSGLGPIGLPFLYYIGYNGWQKAAFKKAVSLHKKNPFEIVHQLTQISFREPGYMWKLGIPFFWGPTGGTALLPWDFFKTLPFAYKLMEGMRFISNSYQSHFVPRIKKANCKAAVIYTYSSEDEKYLRKRAAGKIKQMLDVGTTLQLNISKYHPDNSSTLTGVWCGQLTYRKAPDILLNALAWDELTKEHVRIKIIGTGPLEQSMHNLASALKLNNIEWIRKIPHNEVFEIMEHADFLVHTSLREATSSVIPEALSMGLPVICHDVNGMSAAVNETCGIKIALKSPKESITGFHNAIKLLMSDKDTLNKLKTGALKRAFDITWDNMARTIADDYTNAALSKVHE